MPRVKPDGSLVLPTEHGYDWAENLPYPEDWDDEFKAVRLEEMKLYWDAYHVFGIEDEEYFGDCVSGLDVNAVVFNGVPAIINITEGLRCHMLTGSDQANASSSPTTTSAAFTPVTLMRNLKMRAGWRTISDDN